MSVKLYENVVCPKCGNPSCDVQITRLDGITAIVILDTNCGYERTKSHTDNVNRTDEELLLAVNIVTDVQGTIQE